MQSGTREVWGSSSGKFLMKRLFQKEKFSGAACTACLLGSCWRHSRYAQGQSSHEIWVSDTGARTGILFPSLHLNFLQHDLCCLCKGCVLPPSPPQNPSETEWVDGRAALWGDADAVAVKVLQCTLVCSLVSCLCHWESRAVCIYDPGSHCEGLKSILVKLVWDWLQKKQEKMQDSLAHKANSVLTPGWEMMIQHWILPRFSSLRAWNPLASRAQVITIPLSYSLYLAFWATSKSPHYKKHSLCAFSCPQNRFSLTLPRIQLGNCLSTLINVEEIIFWWECDFFP